MISPPSFNTHNTSNRVLCQYKHTLHRDLLMQDFMSVETSQFPSKGGHQVTCLGDHMD